MARSIFVSFVREDQAFYDRLLAWNEAGKLGPGLLIHARRTDLQDAAAVLALVGNDTQDPGWVHDELGVARSADKLVFPIRIPLTTGAAPEGFRQLTMLPFDAAAIRMALDGSW